MFERFKIPVEPVVATEQPAVPQRAKRGRKTGSGDLRRLSVDVSVEVWAAIHIDAERRGETIKDILSDLITKAYGGQTMHELSYSAQAAMVDQHKAPAKAPPDVDEAKAATKKMFGTR